MWWIRRQWQHLRPYAVWANHVAAWFNLKQPTLGDELQKEHVVKSSSGSTKIVLRNSRTSSPRNTNHRWLFPSLSFTFSLYLLLRRVSLHASLGSGPELFSLIRWGSQGRADWCSMSDAERRDADLLNAFTRLHHTDHLLRVNCWVDCSGISILWVSN